MPPQPISIRLSERIEPPVFDWTNKLQQFMFSSSPFIWRYFCRFDGSFLLLNVPNAIVYFNTSSSNAANASERTVRRAIVFSIKCHSNASTHRTRQPQIWRKFMDYVLDRQLESRCTLTFCIQLNWQALSLHSVFNQHLSISKVSEWLNVVFLCADCSY